MSYQLNLFKDLPGRSSFEAQLLEFNEFEKETQVVEFPLDGRSIPVYINEFWTGKQRAAHSIHEISYRACFKPQLPRFFIERLTNPGEVVYDPFTGRGTTLIEAALMGRIPYGCDINPLTRILVEPRLKPPTLEAVAERLSQLKLESERSLDEELLPFYHPKTLTRIVNLKSYLMERQKDAKFDEVDAWIQMVSTNRLTGHSPGFFSVYTLPPNQALSVESQIKINMQRKQRPPDRDVIKIILKKSRSLLSKMEEYNYVFLQEGAKFSKILTGSCERTPSIASNTVSLVVTSPPFLDVVDYKKDNWLRCWFNGIDANKVDVWQLRKPEDWQMRMTKVFTELKRILVPGGHVAFEVGEVRRGQLLLETLVVPAAVEAGLAPLLIMINDQEFTKTSNCWGVSNLSKGTNTNRIVLLQKQG